MTILDGPMDGRKLVGRVCGGGSSSTSPGTPSSLSCDGYPRPITVSVNGTQQTYTQVCVIVQKSAPVTSSVSASTSAGSLTAHGRQMLDTYVVYSRIIAQAADQAAATTLANSVVITTADSTISASPDHVDSPQALQIDFEVFTAPSTNLTLTAGAGQVAADNYNAILHLTSQAGNASLQNLQGQVSAELGVGSIDAKLTGSGWTGIWHDRIDAKRQHLPVAPGGVPGSVYGPKRARDGVH